MNGLLNFLQSASNTAADTVAGPVDLFSFLLNKAGVPVTEPVGGSEWMRKKGLKKDVPQNAASLGGEAFGLISPIGAAAKGATIAKGLLTMGDNLAAPATLAGPSAGQRGMIDVEALKAQFPEVDFWLSQRGDKATLDRVVVPKEARNQGTGTAFMNALVKAADDDSARLGLSPSSDFGGNKKQLEEFYRRFGFVPNKGRNRDFELMSAMVRQPN